MKSIKHNLYIPLLFLILSLGFSNCDKLPKNGELDGMWQLMEIQYNNNGSYDSIVNQKEKQIYLSIQLDLFAFKSYKTFYPPLTEETIGRFNHTNNKLKLYDFYKHYDDKDVSIDNVNTTILRPLGIDGNKADFTIEDLDSEKMILYSTYARIILRKF